MDRGKLIHNFIYLIVQSTFVDGGLVFDHYIVHVIISFRGPLVLIGQCTINSIFQVAGRIYRRQFWSFRVNGIGFCYLDIECGVTVVVVCIVFESDGYNLVCSSIAQGYHTLCIVTVHRTVRKAGVTGLLDISVVKAHSFQTPA